MRSTTCSRTSTCKSRSVRPGAGSNRSVTIDIVRIGFRNKSPCASAPPCLARRRLERSRRGGRLFGHGRQQRGDHLERSCLGEIVSRGTLMSKEGKRLADFQQTTQLWAGSRYVVVEITITPSEPLGPDPWNSYYAAALCLVGSGRGVVPRHRIARQKTDAKRIEAPQFIEIGSADVRTTILTGGLPFHRRAGVRMLDSLLVCRGETAATFKLAIGVDLAQPALAALELTVPPMALLETGARPQAATGWFFHVDAKNVVATHWESLGQTATSAHGTVGFRVRLMETTGQAGRIHLRVIARWLPRQLDFQHSPIQDLPIEDDKIAL